MKFNSIRKGFKNKRIIACYLASYQDVADDLLSYGQNINYLFTFNRFTNS